MATQQELQAALSQKTKSLIDDAASLQDLAYIAQALKDSGNIESTVQNALIDRAYTLVGTATSLKDIAYVTKAINENVVVDGAVYPYTEEMPYGWLWNEITEESYRLGHNIMAVQQQMRRVVCVGNPQFGGAVYKYLDPENSELYEDGSSAAEDVRGANGYQVFVEIPKFYYRMYKVGALNYYWMGLKNFDGAKVHPAFKKSGWTDSGDGSDVANESAYAYISAFEGVLWDASVSSYVDGVATTPEVDTVADKLVSIAGYKPTSSITIVQGRELCANGGSKQFDWHRYSAMRLCFIVEYMSHDSQNAIPGYTQNTATPTFDNDVLKTGLTLALGNKSGSVSGSENHLLAGGDGGYGGVVANSYRGIENFYGHMHKFVDAVNIQAGAPYVCEIYDSFASDVFVSPYVRALDSTGVAISQPSADGYQSKLWSGSFFVSGIGGTSISKITDYYFQAGGNRVLLSGGHLNHGSLAGVGSLLANHASSHAAWTICSRL